jgi:pimeloyl-ACP methyl ester carboxylesterase
MSSYASVHGLNMYYEVHGAGRPLVLLHGALSAKELDKQEDGNGA